MMNTYIRIITCWTVLSLYLLHAQESPVILTHTQKIDKNRYANIKGSPYLFDDWLNASIMTNEGEEIRGFLTNLNGYTPAIEVRKGDQYMELDAKHYREMVIKKAQNPEKWKTAYGDSLLFVRGMHPKFRDRMVQVLYRGEQISLLSDFSVNLLTKEVQDVGKTVKFESFFKQQTHYLIEGDELTPVRLSKKKLLEKLKHRKEMEQFIKKEKIKLNSIPDIRRLLAFYETFL